MAEDDRLLRAAAAEAEGRAEEASALLAALPPDLAHTAHVLAANRAARAGDEAAWLAALNSYLARWKAGPLALAPGGADGPGGLLPRLRPAVPPAPRPAGDAPLVSVLMAARNAAATVEAAARSIPGQSWPAVELIAVDDASTDATPAILARLAAEDGRVRVLTTPEPLGPYVARNRALTLARGAWVTLQDADDWSVPDRLARHMGSVLKSADPPPASALGALRMQPDGVFAQIRPATAAARDGVLQTGPMTALLEARFLRERLGSWECVRFGADAELLARAAVAAGRRVAQLAQVGLIALDHPASLTRDPASGIHPSLGVTPARKAYREAWRQWQRDALTPATARLAFPPGPPRYPVPSEARVDPDAIRRVLAAAGGG